MIVNVHIDEEINRYEIDDKLNNKLTLLNNLVEQYLNINSKFFCFEINNNILIDDRELFNNCSIKLQFKYEFFRDKLYKLHFNDEVFFFPLNTFKESNVIRVLLFDDNFENNFSEDDNKISFNNKYFKSNKCINDWLVLSFEINKFLSEKNEANIELNIPRPLSSNNNLSKYIGESAYQYLCDLSKEELDCLATLCDYLDIPYLLDTSCAFIAEKFLKNSSLNDLKDFFKDVEI
tara:strand:+ start:428 stop:1129 length:702 start_codon:yes stop_codon:yes gene_type:complete